jgi:HSP20 family protein
MAEVQQPGVSRDDISMEMAGQELVISGEFKASVEGRRALRRAWRSGRFEHRVMLPNRAQADQVTATLADGVLTVTVPKAETERPRRIGVTAG